jgi:8-oxo-dGTP pyrophosphatase MutT (NUDIX family)
MAMSEYMTNVRSKIGMDLLLVPAVGTAVFDDSGRLLLGRHTDDDQWATIGGSMEPGESPREAALRELHEETGLTACILGIVDAYGGPSFEVTYPGGARVAYVVTMYACQLLGGEPRPQADELREIGWFRPEEAALLPQPGDMSRIVPDAFSWWKRRTDPAPGAGARPLGF